jgi:very-short-patch-repair endonuclease
VEYLAGLLVVELDGRLGHELSRDRWADAARDARTLVQGGRTLRLTWGQVLEPCRAAHLVAQLLTSLGWRDAPRPCSAACEVGR